MQTNQFHAHTPSHLLHFTFTHQTNIPSALNQHRARHQITTAVSHSPPTLSLQRILNCFPWPALATENPINALGYAFSPYLYSSHSLYLDSSEYIPTYLLHEMGSMSPRVTEDADLLKAVVPLVNCTECVLYP